MNKYLRILIYAAAGGAAGFGWYYFVGCSGSSCPLTSHWYITTAYGLIGGVITGIPAGKLK